VVLNALLHELLLLEIPTLTPLTSTVYRSLELSMSPRIRIVRLAVRPEIAGAPAKVKLMTPPSVVRSSGPTVWLK
jgi:hypothetical protein